MLAYKANAAPQSRPRPPKPEEYHHPEDGIDYRPRTLPVTTRQLSVESPVQQPDLAAASQENIEMAAKKNVAARGVIATIIEVISRARGASIEEIVGVLTEKFADRDPDGMTATARIQANAHCTSKGRDERRGLVYFKRR